MHRQLRERLVDATGVSDLVVVVFLDVRGFSSFARMAESSEAALFLRSMYMQILDKYFPEAAFFKPTGDGLMIIRHYDKDTLLQAVKESIEASIELVGDFASICADDPMVNFDVPTALGVGIARGAATGLISGDYVLDYSGRPLNLASRLMDLARPTGVVVDGSVLKGLNMPKSFEKRFTEDDVYVKGIADLTPLHVFRSETVSIASINRRPLVGRPFEEDLGSLTFRQLSGRGRYIHVPSSEPIDPDAVRLEYRWPKADARGNAVKDLTFTNRLEPVEVRRAAAGWEILFDYNQALKIMTTWGVKGPWKVHLQLKYSVADDA